MTIAPTVQDIRVFVETPKSLKPTLNWASLKNNLIIPSHLPKIQTSKGLVECQPEKLLNAIGAAITDDRLAHGSETPEAIFVPETKFKVVSTVNRVLIKLAHLKKQIVGSEEVHEICENSLLDEGETLAAKGYLLYRTQKQRRHQTVKKLEVIRRNGKKVSWNSEKIVHAIYKAFLADLIGPEGQQPEDMKNQEASEKAALVAQAVIHDITSSGREVIHIEEIQDLVEKYLSEMGYDDIAKRFRLYRLERARLRLIKEAQVDTIIVLPELVTPNLLARIDFASIDLELPLSRQELAQRLIYGMDVGLTAHEKMNTILLNARQLMEMDTNFRFFCARILLTYIYEEVLDWKVEDGMGKLKKAHETGFAKYLNRGIEIGLLSPDLKKLDIKSIAQKINPMADLKFDFLGIMTMYDRYLLHERDECRDPSIMIIDAKNKRRIEVPQYLWMRVAMGLTYNEKEKEEAAITFYNIYTSKKFCSGTPTLFNSGTQRPQLSSCYGLTAGDEIGGIRVDEKGRNYPVGIFGTFMNCAFLSKFAGGLGVDFTSVRGMGSHIKGTNGESQGIVPFLKIMNDTVVAVNQGGKRRGVVCCYLESWHNDIEEFLELRKNTGDDRRRTHDMHTANWIPDLFMIRAIKGQDWTLFRTSDVPDLHETYGAKFKEQYEKYEKLHEEGKLWGRKIRASALWKKMLSALFETGHPWITFKDPCNIRSPQDHCGVVHNSNLCTEIVLNNSDEEHFVCNLGSLNLATFVRPDGTIDREDLAKTIQIAVRMLDNVIDINFYPTTPAETANVRHRPIGLGLMGWQDALHLLQIPFESDKATAFADEIMEFIAWHAYNASCMLAKEKGAYKSFKGSKWDRGLMPLDTLDLLEKERGVPIDVNRDSKMPWDQLRSSIKKHGMRNSNVLAIAPTATISNIFGCSACIEPDYRHIYSKSNLSGEFISVTPLLVQALKQMGLWNKDMLEDLKYHKGELDNMTSIPDSIKAQFKTAFKIDPKAMLKQAAVRQKWIDQALSLNLFLDKPDEKTMSLIYLLAWKMGLKTTYYLKNKSVTDIEDASLDIKRKTQEMQQTVKACSLADPNCESCQ
ncbi:MAG: ribonucleoside-diphosphate reductase subunit alpha [Verrucomicrobia bacterium]|nr:ribonucleoside-diphosphate reductase subunit alpha [Verrucomicrobiota bacterium]MBS0637064.1 ribonucleoside-diphosphate reductase subunit alpha [Verrucomicrobiota bacterium]